jgi:hypothetical protein
MASTDFEDEDPEETAELLAPFGRKFPGLAPATSRLADLGGPRPLTPSTCPPESAWSGPIGPPTRWCPRAGTGPPLSWIARLPLALVLRSWEERFGARLMHLGFDTMALLVERPVPDADEALSVGAEHFALCTDNMTSWWFWWD